MADLFFQYKKSVIEVFFFFLLSSSWMLCPHTVHDGLKAGCFSQLIQNVLSGIT